MIAQDISFCKGLIGKPWVSGARGPDTFDCWGVIFHAYKERRGITLPLFATLQAKDSLAVSLQAMAEVREEWTPVDNPEHFCAVGMGTNRHIHHVGLWLAMGQGTGGILHAQENKGVLFQSAASVRQAGMQHFTFYRFRP